MDDGLNGNENRLNQASLKNEGSEVGANGAHLNEPKQSTETVCIICHEQKQQGIQICGQFLCTECERDIVHSDVHDRRYQHYVDEMKRIWLSALSL